MSMSHASMNYEESQTKGFGAIENYSHA